MVLPLGMVRTGPGVGVARFAKGSPARGAWGIGAGQPVRTRPPWLVTPPTARAQSALRWAEPQTFTASLAIESDITSQPVSVSDELPCTCTACDAVGSSARMQALAAVTVTATERAFRFTGPEE